jgi:ATP-binding cassette subfamily B protein
MDTFGMIAIALLAFYLSQDQHGIAGAVPVLGALAIGAQRLLPLIQQIYSSWAVIVSSQESLRDSLKFFDFSHPLIQKEKEQEPLSFNERIQFKNVGFRYDDSLPFVLKGLNLTITKGARVGIVGATGSGKSTLLDILMGLLSPSQGEVSVDNVALNDENLQAWQKNIAHVPQAIYLADTTIAENIAFGIDQAAIDMSKIRTVAAQAQIDQLIEGLPLGYREMVGERGIKLSGGQRQRIGVARALYKDSKVLIFDEATSALDSTTESQLISTITKISPDVTVIQVAHRLSTLQNCDLIITLENGEVANIGTYHQLIENISV